LVPSDKIVGYAAKERFACLGAGIAPAALSTSGRVLVGSTADNIFA
jgi:hypothetical protein